MLARQPSGRPLTNAASAGRSWSISSRYAEAAARSKGPSLPSAGVDRRRSGRIHSVMLARVSSSRGRNVEVGDEALDKHVGPLEPVVVVDDQCARLERRHGVEMAQPQPGAMRGVEPVPPPEGRHHLRRMAHCDHDRLHRGEHAPEREEEAQPRVLHQATAERLVVVLHDLRAPGPER